MRLKPLAIVLCGVFPLAGQDPKPAIEARNNAYAVEIEQYFRDYLVNAYEERAGQAWHRSYRSIDALVKSVAPNRERYRRMLNPPELKRTGPARREPFPRIQGVRAEWLSVPMSPLKAEGVLVIPQDASGPVPLVIAQHGIGSFPERVFGIDDPGNAYHDYGHALVAAGFAVLAPMNLYSVPKRNRMERLARLADTTLPGIEFARMQALLDAALEDQRIDGKRVGMWGLSLGGMAAMFWTPLEPRIRCAVVAAWFNHRRNKMVIPDKRYSCFLETTEEHAFFRGWLTEFTDSDTVSLICPRPLLVQHGRKDGIAWWPQVNEEFEAAREHYRKLKIEDRIQIDMHDGGHEVRLESGLAFLKKWL